MFARTSRLTLRPGWPEDAPELARAIGHRQVIDTLAHVPWPYALEDAESFLGAERGSTEPHFLIFDRPASAPRLVGGIGIAADGVTGEHALGYWVRPELWGRGYATEAGRAVVAMARHALGLRRLSAGHFADNPASGRVLRKLGFQPAGGTELHRSLGRGSEAPFLRYELSLGEPGAMPLAA